MSEQSHRHHGFTLTELLIAVTLFALVIAMIGLPLIMGTGFIKRANARGDSLRVGKQVIDRLEADLQHAAMVFDLPPDGSSIAFLESLPGAESATDVTFTRYACMLSFPWVQQRILTKVTSVTNSTTVVVDDVSALRVGMVVTVDNPTSPDVAGATIKTINVETREITFDADVSTQNDATFVERWSLLQPNYAAMTHASSPYVQTYQQYYQPFHQGHTDANPYVLTRFHATMPWRAITEVDTAWRDIPHAFDAAYPLSAYDPYRKLSARADARNTLWRMAQNDMVSLTPRADDWDVPTFTVTPARIASETLARTTDAQEQPVSHVLRSKYPMWAARNLDMDEAAHLNKLYLSPMDDRQNLDQAIRTSNWSEFGIPATDALRPLWWEFYPLGVNPFGFKVRIFNKDGALVYGTTGTPNAEGRFPTMEVQRHFMDWPPIGRDATQKPWTPEDIARQRFEGKLVFAQPYTPPTLMIKSFDVTTTSGTMTFAGCQLPLPNASWGDHTAIVDIPKELTIEKIDGTKLTFRAAGHTDPERFDYSQKDRYCLVNPEKLSPRLDRVIIFSHALAPPTDDEEPWTIVNDARFTISDLKVDDIVEVTYSTRAVLDVSLTTSRQSPGIDRPEDSRNDYRVNRRIYARKALNR